MHVIVPSEKPILYTPQLLLLTGTLSVGNREEADGRMSIVRLTLDASALPRPRRQKDILSARGGANALMTPARFGIHTHNQQESSL